MKTAQRPNYHSLRLLALLLGLAAFVSVSSHWGGPLRILFFLRTLGWGYAFIILNSLVWMLLYAKAWQLCFAGFGERPSYLSLLKVKLCGEAVNFMTPVGFLAGDPVRVLLLRQQTGLASRWRVVILDRLLHLLATQLFCFLALWLLWGQAVAFPRWLLILLLAVYAGLSGFFLVLAVNLWQGKKPAVLPRLLSWTQRFSRLSFVSARLAALQDEFVSPSPRAHPLLLKAFALHFSGRLLGGVEIAILLCFFQGQWSLAFALILAALTSFFSLAGLILPGSLGVMELMYARFGALYGFSPEMGVSMQIVRRLRVCFWIVVGILIFDYRELVQFLRKKKDLGPPS